MKEIQEAIDATHRINDLKSFGVRNRNMIRRNTNEVPFLRWKRDKNESSSISFCYIDGDRVEPQPHMLSPFRDYDKDPEVVGRGGGNHCCNLGEYVKT